MSIQTEIETDYGTIKVKLYNSTPKHRDNFIKLASEGFYDDLALPYAATRSVTA